MFKSAAKIQELELKVSHLETMRGFDKRAISELIDRLHALEKHLGVESIQEPSRIVYRPVTKSGGGQ